MKSNRTNMVLHMVFLLQDHGYFTEKEIRQEQAVSRSTFFRALSDFRCYLQENRPWQSLTYDGASGRYMLS